jgi:hypothetical protein
MTRDKGCGVWADSVGRQLKRNDVVNRDLAYSRSRGVRGVEARHCFRGKLQYLSVQTIVLLTSVIGLEHSDVKACIACSLRISYLALFSNSKRR